MIGSQPGDYARLLLRIPLAQRSLLAGAANASSYIARWLKEVAMPPVIWFPLVRIHQ
jgi:hypothetical protein